MSSRRIRASESSKEDLIKFIPAQMRIAKNLNLPAKKIELSNRKDKKYVVETLEGKKIHYGALGVDDFLIHQDEERRKRFHNRFRNNPSKDDPSSGLFWSSRLLW